MDKSDTTVSNKEEIIEQGIYLYCIADGAKETSLGNIGIDNNEVYAIPYRGISLIVHRCNAMVYKSEDKERVKGWILSHQKVVDIACEKFDTVLPLGFDTIIKGESEKGISPEQNAQNWLKNDYDSLKEKLDKVRNKAEYGIQVSWDPKIIADKITNSVDEIKKLSEEIKLKGIGTAYMYEQKIKNLLRKEMEKMADEYFKDFYARIKKEVFDIRIDKTKKVDENLQMLMNLSCLVVKENVQGLGQILEEIKKEDGFHIRFTGPWPPYSFT